MRNPGAGRSAVVGRACDEGRESHHGLPGGRGASDASSSARRLATRRSAPSSRGSSSAARIMSTSGAATSASRQPTYCVVGMVRLVSSGLVMSSYGRALRRAPCVAVVNDAIDAPTRSADSVMRLRSAPEFVIWVERKKARFERGFFARNPSTPSTWDDDGFRQNA